jgi:hypothetical protein
MDQLGPFILAQLLMQLPFFLVCLLGLILAAVFWRRSPAASVLTMLGILIHLVVVAVQIVVPQYLVAAREDMNWTLENLGRVLSVVNVISSLVRAAGFGLLLAAVFTGRSPRPARLDVSQDFKSGMA